MLGIFKKLYTVRRFAPQTLTNGYPQTNHTDLVTALDVQPLGAQDVRALPEGSDATTRLKSIGGASLAAADNETATQGDLLYYHGKWYECVSAVTWDHTPLAHCTAQWTLIANQTKIPPPEVKTCATTGSPDATARLCRADLSESEPSSGVINL